MARTDNRMKIVKGESTFVVFIDFTLNFIIPFFIFYLCVSHHSQKIEFINPQPPLVFFNFPTTSLNLSRLPLVLFAVFFSVVIVVVSHKGSRILLHIDSCTYTQVLLLSYLHMKLMTIFYTFVVLLLQLMLVCVSKFTFFYSKEFLLHFSVS